MAGQRRNRRVAHVSEAPPPNETVEATAPTTTTIYYVGPARPGVIVGIAGQPAQATHGEPLELSIAEAERLLLQPDNWSTRAPGAAPPAAAPAEPEEPEAPTDPAAPETPDAGGSDGGAE